MRIRRILRNSFVASALIACAIGLAAPAQAMPSDPCQDAANLAAANAATSRGYADLSITMYSLGYYQLSMDYAEAANFYALAADTVLNDAGC